MATGAGRCRSGPRRFRSTLRRLIVLAPVLAVTACAAGAAASRTSASAPSSTAAVASTSVEESVGSAPSTSPTTSMAASSALPPAPTTAAVRPAVVITLTCRGEAVPGALVGVPSPKGAVTGFVLNSPAGPSDGQGQVDVPAYLRDLARTGPAPVMASTDGGMSGVVIRPVDAAATAFEACPALSPEEALAMPNGSLVNVSGVIIDSVLCRPSDPRSQPLRCGTAASLPVGGVSWTSLDHVDSTVGSQHHRNSGWVVATGRKRNGVLQVQEIISTRTASTTSFPYGPVTP